MLAEDDKGKILTEDEMRAKKQEDRIFSSQGRIPFAVTEVTDGHVWGNFLECLIVGECCDDWTRGMLHVWGLFV